jgi:hypothetical protein
VEFECGLDETDLSGSPEYQKKVDPAFTKLEPYGIPTIHYFYRPIKTINIKCLPTARHI